MACIIHSSVKMRYPKFVSIFCILFKKLQIWYCRFQPPGQRPFLASHCSMDTRALTAPEPSGLTYMVSSLYQICGLSSQVSILCVNVVFITISFSFYLFGNSIDSTAKMRPRDHWHDRSVDNTQPSYAVHAEISPDDATQILRHQSACARQVGNRRCGGVAGDQLQVSVVLDVRTWVDFDWAEGVHHASSCVPPAYELQTTNHDAGVHRVLKRSKVENWLAVDVVRVKKDGSPAHALCFDKCERW
jgi:hypothetical protein